MGRLGKGRLGRKRGVCEGNRKVERERLKDGLGNYKKAREGREGKRKREEEGECMGNVGKWE